MSKNNKHIILTYHKVGEGLDAISKKLFKLHLFIIKHFFNYVSLPEAIIASQKSELPKHSISVSFDDGYSSFYYKALPWMLKYKFKPTLFLSSGYLNKYYMWNDLTEINGFRTDEVKYLTLKERNSILKKSPISTDDPLITIDQLKEISFQIDIGGHTLDHPILALESESSAQVQIFKDRFNIKDITQKEVFLFAYPNGKYNRDFNDTTIHLVKKAGYNYAFTTEPYAYNPDTFHNYIIPRISTPKNGIFASLKFFLSLYLRNLTPKVIMFESGNGFGGAALSAFEINQTIPRCHGFDFKICISTLKGKYSIFKEISSLDLVNFGKVDWNNMNKSLKSKFNFFYNILKALNYLIKEQPQLVYLNNDPYNNLHIILVCKLLRINYIMHHRGIVNNTLITKYVIKNALVNVVISKSVQERVLSVVQTANTKLIYNGFTPIENGTAILSKPNKLLMIGGFYGWKGQGLVLEAFEDIASENNDTTIEFVGLSDTPTNIEMEFIDKVNKSKYSERIKISKFTKDISNIILNSDMIIHASTEPEPFGRVVVEGMSAKRIVIASKIGGPSEIIEHAKNGFLFDPFNKNDLVELFKQIFSGTFNLKEISENAYVRSTEFSKFENSKAICKLILSNLKSSM